MLIRIILSSTTSHCCVFVARRWLYHPRCATINLVRTIYIAESVHRCTSHEEARILDTESDPPRLCASDQPLFCIVTHHLPSLVIPCFRTYETLSFPNLQLARERSNFLSPTSLFAPVVCYMIKCFLFLALVHVGYGGSGALPAPAADILTRSTTPIPGHNGQPGFDLSKTIHAADVPDAAVGEDRGLQEFYLTIKELLSGFVSKVMEYCRSMGTIKKKNVKASLEEELEPSIPTRTEKKKANLVQKLDREFPVQSKKLRGTAMPALKNARERKFEMARARARRAIEKGVSFDEMFKKDVTPNAYDIGHLPNHGVTNPHNDPVYDHSKAHVSAYETYYNERLRMKKEREQKPR